MSNELFPKAAAALESVMSFISRLKRWLILLSRKRAGASEDARFFDTETEDENETDPFNPFPAPVRLEILDIFDLHTIAPRDVKRAVEEYLREAHAAGFRVVRIIHGKGTGAQREMVRRILGRTPFIERFTDAPPEAGGWGATIAYLLQPKR